MTPCPREADLKNGSCQKGERESTPAKQRQGKAWATKAQQDLPVNVAINSRLLACKPYGEELYLYVRPMLRVGPNFFEF
jgi:hypothetical protein